MHLHIKNQQNIIFFLPKPSHAAVWHAALCSCDFALQLYLVKRDLLQVPVVDVEEQDHAAILVSAGQNHRVARLDGAADRLGGQVLKQLRILLPEAHVA